MRVGITVDPYYPVPPLQYGGIERIADFVVRGLEARGHTTILFAHPESTATRNVIGYGVPPHQGRVPRLRELWQLGMGLWRRRRQFDVVLSWGRLAALVPMLPLRRLPKIQRYCRGSAPWRSVAIATKLGRESVVFVGSSDAVYKNRPDRTPKGGRWLTIYDGVEVDKYQFVPEVSPDAPLVFLGRLEPMKGAHTAIAVAKATGRRLIIAGNKVSTPESLDYFNREITPHVDGKQIEYVGPVDDAQKSELLGPCAAMLFPTQFHEGFGIVMAEAMACGVPVLAPPIGAVPEVVLEGVNGFRCGTVNEYVAGVRKLRTLNRNLIRQDCERRFDARIIVNQFEQLCAAMIQNTRR